MHKYVCIKQALLFSLMCALMFAHTLMHTQKYTCLPYFIQENFILDDFPNINCGVD